MTSERQIMKLSIVIPCYNEETTLAMTVESVLAVASPDLTVEIVVVDDCSTDTSRRVAERLAREHPEVRFLAHDVNRGKGAALRTGFQAATGDFVGVQDADNEYDPRDYLKMLAVAAEFDADVVYGSRYLRDSSRQVLRFWHSTMNRFLTFGSNVFSDLEVTDMETCYKMFRREVLAEIAPQLREDRFGFEPEVTARLAKALRRHGWRLAECAIKYRPRTFSEGKKIGYRDGLRALWCILRYNLFG